MNKDEVKAAREKTLDDMWYISRVLLGFLIQVFMIACVLALVEQSIEVMRLIPDHKDAVQKVPALLLDVMVGITVFTSGMAGIGWVKSLYIRYVLPEVMDEVSKKILQK